MSVRGDWWLSFTAGFTVALSVFVYGIFQEWWM